MFRSKKENNINIINSLYKEVFDSLQLYFKKENLNHKLGNEKLLLNVTILTRFIIFHSISKLSLKKKEDKYRNDLLNLNHKLFINFFNYNYTIDSFSDMSTIIDDKFSNLQDIRANTKPPECWYSILSDVVGIGSPEFFKLEILKFEKGLSIIKDSKGINLIKEDCELKLKTLKNAYTLFDKSEMKFRQIIRNVRTKLESINFKSIVKDLKSLEKSK